MKQNGKPIVLKGPHDPDHLRQQVGRYGDRFYVDNLPPCELHTPNDPVTPVPSVSVIKNAWPKFLTSWAGRQAAEFAVTNKNAWANLDDDAAIDLIANASDRAKNRAARRGSAIHLIIEDLAQGISPDYTQAGDDVIPFIGCIEQMVLDLALEPIVTEAVVFNHGIGYGGTFDMIAGSVHGTCLFDWKTRKAPNPYPEESVQGAAYYGADYMIVERDHNAVRMPLPEVDRLCIVVIAPDTYKVHEINEQGAWETWEGLSHFWYAKQGTKFFDGVLATPRRTPIDTDPANMRERILALQPRAREHLARMWPNDLPTLKQDPTTADLLQINRLIADIEKRSSAGFAWPSVPDDGDTVDLEMAQGMEEKLEALTPEQQTWVSYWLDSADPPVRMRLYGRTYRKFTILHMLILAAQVAEDMESMGELIPNELGYATIEDVDKSVHELSWLLEHGNNQGQRNESESGNDNAE